MIEGSEIKSYLDSTQCEMERLLFRSSGRTVQDVRLEYFHLRALVVVTAACHMPGWKGGSSTLGVLEYFAAIGLLPESTINYARRNLRQLGGLIEAVSGSQQASGAGSILADVYQDMLMIELGRNERGEYYLGRSKHGRDVSGSYYTPRDLAWETARRAVDELIEQRSGICRYSWGDHSGADRRTVNALLSNILIADLSCGAGDLLWAVVRYAREFSDVSAAVLQNCWGYDIDPLALLVTHIELTRRCGVSGDRMIEERLAGQLVLGNPLLNEMTPASLEGKVALAATGRAYAPGMGLSPSDYPGGKQQFDLIVGNPPWEKVRLEERKFFTMLRSDISLESNRAVRARLIDAAKQSAPDIHDLYESTARDYSLLRARLVAHPLIPHIPRGELNTYTLFPVLIGQLLGDAGVGALILKAAIVTSPVNSELFRKLRESGSVREIHLFDNSNRIFPIDSREKFCVIILASGACESSLVSFGNNRVVPLGNVDTVEVSEDVLKRLNPETHMLPNVASIEEYELLNEICASHPIFRDVFPECRFGRLLHLTTHATHVYRDSGEGLLPVFEGKFIGHHDLRFATFEDVPTPDCYAGKATARRLSAEEKLHQPPISRYFVEELFWRELSRSYQEPYMLAWRSLTSATNTRTMIASIAPFGPATQSVQFLQCPDPNDLLLLAGIFNSTTFDYLVRLKIPGIDLTQSVVRQVPVPDRSDLDRVHEMGGRKCAIRAHIEQRVRQLYLGEDSMGSLTTAGPPSGDKVAKKSRTVLMSEIDELVANAYGLDAVTRLQVARQFGTQVSE